MLNFRKRLKEIEENKKKEIVALEEKLGELSEEVFAELEKLSFRSFSKITSITFRADEFHKTISVESDSGITLVKDKKIENIDLVQMFKVFEGLLKAENFEITSKRNTDLTVRIKE